MGVDVGKGLVLSQGLVTKCQSYFLSMYILISDECQGPLDPFFLAPPPRMPLCSALSKGSHQARTVLHLSKLVT